MSRILVLLEHKENRRLLSEWLGTYYEVVVIDAVVGTDLVSTGVHKASGGSQTLDLERLLKEPFDLCILDGVALDRSWGWVQARKEAEQSVFLPFLFVTCRQDVGIVTRHLWKSVDELIISPIEKVELQARVEMLLRSRQLSLQLKTANERLENEIGERQRVEEARVKAIAALRQSEAQFRRFVNSNIIGIVFGETKGNITQANDAFLEMVGYTRSDLNLGKLRWNEMTPLEYQHLDEQALQYLATSGVCTPFEKEFICANGSRVPVLMGMALLDGFKDKYVAFVLNITQRKQAEAEIRTTLQKERELRELRSRFVSMVSHEFRNPLHVILASSQIIERYSDQWTSEKKGSFFQRIKMAVTKMTELLDDILFIGKTTEGKLEFNPTLVDLIKFCNEIVEESQLSSGNRHSIKFLHQENCLNAVVDQNLLRHIFTNLLSNAIKYSPAGGTIYFELISEDGEAIFKIKDTGIGIPQEDQERLFEAFHRAKNVGNIPGTGLGLSIVKQSVEVHGGQIHVESEVGVGTTFTISLPLIIND